MLIAHTNVWKQVKLMIDKGQYTLQKCNNPLSAVMLSQYGLNDLVRSTSAYSFRLNIVYILWTKISHTFIIIISPYFPQWGMGPH